MEGAKALESNETLSTYQLRKKLKLLNRRRGNSRSVGRQYSSIQRVIDNFKSAGIYTSKPRPSKLTIRERRTDSLCKRAYKQASSISSKDMRKSVLKDEWEKIRAEGTAKLVNSMPKRLQEVLER
ncbi:hypothetical protein TNCV_4168791 [Trichonephila clavipes]|nr:hypothetical protein TNCV_4168791 [Trichonephila clavipes]